MEDNNIRTFHFDSKNEDATRIIFIHGYAATSEYFHNFYKENLQDKYSLDTIELPGLGLNHDLLDNYNIESYADYCVNFIKEKGWNNFILIGHSMGGAIVELICNLIPNLVKKAILICPMNSSFSMKLLNFITWKRRNDIKALKYNLHFLYYHYENIFHSDEEIEQYFIKSNEYYKKNHEVLMKIVHSFFNLRLRKKLISAEKNNKIETLVLFADEDEVIDAKTGVKRLSKNNNYKVLSLPNSGHMLFIEQPAETKDAILAWLN